MKIKTKTPVLLLMVMVIAFAFIACVDQNVKLLGTEAELKVFKIESSGTTVVTDTAAKVALPIPSSLMDKPDLSADDLYGVDYDQEGTNIGWVDIRVRNKETDKITGRLRPVVSQGAQAQWGIGTRTNRPYVFYDTRVPVTLDSREYIYVRVTSEDSKITNYYRFDANLLSWTTNLQYININNREGKAGASVDGVSKGGSAWNKASECSLSIGLQEGQNALVVPTTFDPKATVKYCVMANDTTEPTDFTPSDERLNISDQNFLYVEVTAENTLDKEYFKFKVSVGRIATIASFKLAPDTNAAHDIDVYGLGLPQSTWATVGLGEYKTADQPAAGYTIKLVLDDPDASVVWEKIANDKAPEPATFNSAAKIRFDNSKDTANPGETISQSLAIKIKSANNVVTMYYKVRITNLAANIRTHPKSAWYYRDDIKNEGKSDDGKKNVAALTVELDRPGTYSYQWYESDSWYGTYGRHGTSLDEKNNITTVNGGPGQYFYLVQGNEPPISLTPKGYTDDDWKLSPGAWKGGPDPNTYYWADYSRGGEPMAWLVADSDGGKTSTITPRIDWEDDTDNMIFYGTPAQNNSFPKHPAPPKVYFFAGATCETRYYWVKVTDDVTGLSVTSERALILTETNPDMEHFIFDLSILPKKNIKPFTKNGTAYDNIYKIDLKNYPFPNNDVDKDGKGYFNPGKYQICIAHAQYFLPDGRPWTQNWTHGNLHFGLDDGSLIWYHNNMGANGGSIPLQAPHSSQGGLAVKPQWIGFTPSGDPAKGLPPPINDAGDLPKGIYSMDATKKYPAGVAQGYFASFIELLEIRFSTPPPPK